MPESYHVEYDDAYYSVPYTLYKQEVTIRTTTSTVEIINANRERVALHQRRLCGSRYVTNPAHMPESHRIQLERNRRSGYEYLEWASTIGEKTRIVIEKILNTKDFEVTAYRSCMGILQCAKKFSPERLESVCEQALHISSPCYTTIKHLLQNPPPEKKVYPLPTHENLRNPAEFV